MSIVILSLGTNVGNKPANIKSMEEELAKLSKKPIICSPLYESAAVDVKDKQENYYNKIVRIETDESPEKLLEITQKIEKMLGRDKKWEKAPRTADIDILLFENIQKSTPELTIPHPRMFFRRFAIEGLKTIAPDLTNPFTGELFADLEVAEDVLLQKVKIIE